MSSMHQLLLNPPGSLIGGNNVEAEFGVIPEVEGSSEPPAVHLPNPRDSSDSAVQKQIKPRTIRTALKKLWLDEMLLTKQILCPVPGCTMVFATLQGIQSHYQSCTGLNESGIVRCEFCGEQFLSQSISLEIHMAEEHRHERKKGLAKGEDHHHHTGIKLEDRPPPKTKKFRGPPEITTIASSPPPDMIESRRKNVAFSRNQEELIDCEELEGVVRFPLRNLPKGEQEDPLQLPAVMMNLDINLKPKPFSFDDLDENSMMDDTLLSGPLKMKSEPIDNAEDDPQYISNMIKKMPEPDLKTVPPVRKRSRQQAQSQSSGSDVRIVQVILRANPTEPNAVQSILRDPQFVDAVVQQSFVNQSQPLKKKRKGKLSFHQQQQQQQASPVYVVAVNDPQEQQQLLSGAQKQQPTSQHQSSGAPNIIKRPIRSRKQMFPPPTPSGLVQVTTSLDQGQKFLQTHTLSDKPQVRQEVIDSFFSQSGSQTLSHQPSTSYGEETSSSQLVHNINQQASHVAQVVQQASQPEFHNHEEYQPMQVVNSNDVLNSIGDQGCLIVPPEAFNQLEGAHLIVQDGQIIVQNRNGERVEGCQVFYASNPGAFTNEGMHHEEQNFVAHQMHHTQDQQQQHHHHQQQQQQQQQQHHHQHHDQQNVMLTQMPSSSASQRHQNTDNNHQQLVMSQDLQVLPGTSADCINHHSSGTMHMNLLDMKDPSLSISSSGRLREDADTTATQAAEALLTLGPQNRCMAASSPLQLPPELLKDTVEDVRTDSEMFQVIPDPEPSSSSPPNEQLSTSDQPPDGMVHSTGGNGTSHRLSPPAQELAVSSSGLN